MTTATQAPVTGRPRKARLSTRDRVTVALMILIPTAVAATLVWVPAMATIVMSFFDWDGFGPFSEAKFVGMRWYTEAATIYLVLADHTSTSFPLTVSIRARAMPQVPAPRIPIRFITFVLRIRRAPVWRGVRPVCTFTGLYSSIVPESFCRVNYSAVLHKVSTCFSPISSIPCNFSKPFAFISKSCYSILVGFVGFSFFPLDFDPALRYMMCPPTCSVCLFKF